MSICPSCQGVLGRDCFNPVECASITNDMHYRALQESIYDCAFQEGVASVKQWDKWIDINDSYPPDEDDVLLFCGWKITGKYLNRESKKGFFTEDGCGAIYHVSHWLALPCDPL